MSRGLLKVEERLLDQGGGVDNVELKIVKDVAARIFREKPNIDGWMVRDLANYGHRSDKLRKGCGVDLAVSHPYYLTLHAFQRRAQECVRILTMNKNLLQSITGVGLVFQVGRIQFHIMKMDLRGFLSVDVLVLDISLVAYRMLLIEVVCCFSLGVRVAACHSLSCNSRILKLDYELNRGHNGIVYFDGIVYIAILLLGIYMGKHVGLSYSCYVSFKVLAVSYLEIGTHDLLPRIFKETRLTIAKLVEELHIIVDPYLEAVFVNHFKMIYTAYTFRANDKEQIICLTEGGDVYKKLALFLIHVGPNHRKLKHGNHDGRLDREINVDVLDEVGQLQIFPNHTKNMKLAHNADLAKSAGNTHGYVVASVTFCFTIMHGAAVATLEILKAISVNASPTQVILCFTEAEWKPQDFKSIYLLALLYMLILNVPLIAADSFGGYAPYSCQYLFFVAKDMLQVKLEESKMKIEMVKESFKDPLQNSELHFYVLQKASIFHSNSKQFGSKLAMHASFFRAMTLFKQFRDMDEKPMKKEQDTEMHNLVFQFPSHDLRSTSCARYKTIENLGFRLCDNRWFLYFE